MSDKPAMLRVLADIRRRIIAGDLTGIALVGIADDGCESVIACVGYADGGDEEWCEAIDDLRKAVLDGEVSALPDDDGHGAN
jgi:hypothetical protein